MRSLSFTKIRSLPFGLPFMSCPSYIGHVELVMKLNADQF